MTIYYTATHKIHINVEQEGNNKKIREPSNRIGRKRKRKKPAENSRKI